MELAAGAGEGLGVVGPHAGGVDDLPGADPGLLAGLQVGQDGSDDAFALAQEAADAGAVGGQGSVRGGRAGQEHGVAGVVDLGVPVLDGADQGVGAQGGGFVQGAAFEEVAVVGQAAGGAGGGGHGVVEQDAGADVGAFPQAVLEGVEEGDGADQVGGEGLEEEAAFLEGFGDEAEVEHFEVAQAAVDEFAGAAGGARGPVAGFDEAGAQAAGGGVQGCSGADDAASDDEDVEFALGHPGEGAGACFG